MENSVIVEELQLLSKKLELIQNYISLKFGSDFKEFCQSNDGKGQRGSYVSVDERPVFVDILDDDEIADIKDEIIEVCPGFEIEQECPAHLSDGDVEAHNGDLGNIEEVSTSKLHDGLNFSRTDKKGRFLCPGSDCPSTFVHKRDVFRNWKTVHLNQRSFVCERCGKAFQLKHHLQRHAKGSCTNENVGKEKRSKRKSKTINDAQTLELAVKSIENEDVQELENEVSKNMEEEVDCVNWEPTEVELGRFGCKDCSSTFCSKWDAKLHWKTIHLDIGRFVCYNCDKRFKLKHHLKRHMLNCGQSSGEQCEQQLNENLDSENSRKVGIENGDNSVSKIKAINCTDPKCAATFSNKWDFGRHWRTVHLKLRPFECKNCKKTYKLKSHLWRHAINCGTSTTSQKEYVCPQSNCGVNFTNKRKFNSHLTKHKKGENENAIPKPFKCLKNEGCDKMFRTLGALNYHVKQVHDEKTECCYFCQKMFSTRDHLFTHLTMHFEEKWHKCDVEGCGKAFHTNSNLKRHKKQH